MIELDQQAIKEFQEIYREDYGVELDDGLAHELAHKFFALMDVVTKPFPDKE